MCKRRNRIIKFSISKNSSPRSIAHKDSICLVTNTFDNTSTLFEVSPQSKMILFFMERNCFIILVDFIEIEFIGLFFISNHIKSKASWFISTEEDVSTNMNITSIIYSLNLSPSNSIFFDEIKEFIHSIWFNLSFHHDCKWGRVERGDTCQ